MALPAIAAARKPIISYVDGAGKFQLYDAELGHDLIPAPPVPAGFPTFRWGMSLNGRYIVFNDQNKKLHLLDRRTNSQLPLPGIDVLVNPNDLTVSNTGLIAFDENGDKPTRVYSSATRKLVDVGLGNDNHHRQPKLSGDGRFLATTCLDTCVTDDMNGDSDVYVQNLGTKQDTTFTDDNNRDEEHPCISGDGHLVAFNKRFPNANSPNDIFLYDRNAAAFVPLTGLNNNTDDDTFCVLDSAAGYVGFSRQGQGFKVYSRASQSLLTLPPKPFDMRYSSFSAPYKPPRHHKGGGQGGPVLSAVSMLRRVFAVGRRRTPVVARRRIKRGSAFRYTLSEAATVRIRIQRKKAGRRVGRRCRKLTRRNRARRHCARYVRAGTLVRRNRPAGKNVTRFSGRVGRRALRPGRYRALITATDSSGNTSGTRRVGFRIVRLRRH